MIPLKFKAGMTKQEQDIQIEDAEAKLAKLVDLVDNLQVKVDDLEQKVHVKPRPIVPLTNSATLGQVVTKINEIISKLRLN